jgi:hypothetical protein
MLGGMGYTHSDKDEHLRLQLAQAEALIDIADLLRELNPALSDRSARGSGDTPLSDRSAPTGRRQQQTRQERIQEQMTNALTDRLLSGLTGSRPSQPPSPAVAEYEQMADGGSAISVAAVVAALNSKISIGWEVADLTILPGHGDQVRWVALMRKPKGAAGL